VIEDLEEPMKVLVFDTGDDAGRAVIAEALDAGHEVTAVVEEGRGVATSHERLEVLPGDVTDRSFVDKAVLGKDAVVSVQAVTHRRPVTLFSDAAANIVEALEAAGPRRVVCVSSNEVDPDGPGVSLLKRFYVKLIIHRRYRNKINDLERMEAELERTALDWTVLRPAKTTAGPATGQVRTANGGHVPGAGRLTTGDLGRYIATHLDDPTTYRSVIELAG